jgi:hypothetical protein
MSPTPTNNSVVLPADLERRRRISVREAAALKGISEESFRRHFRDLIEQTTPGRQTVRLSDVLEEED